MDLAYSDLPNGVRVAELTGTDVSLGSHADAAELVGNASFAGADAVLLDAAHVPAAFFDLSTGLTGEILQKFANYRMRIVIVHPDVGSGSESLRAFAAESNRGGHVAFVGSRDEGLERLGR